MNKYTFISSKMRLRISGNKAPPKWYSRVPLTYEQLSTTGAASGGEGGTTPEFSKQKAQSRKQLPVDISQQAVCGMQCPKFDWQKIKRRLLIRIKKMYLIDKLYDRM